MQPSCRTPRRNLPIEAALASFLSVREWAARALCFLLAMARCEQQAQSEAIAPHARRKNPGTRLRTHSLTHSLAHSLTRSLTRSLTHSLAHSLTQWDVSRVTNMDQMFAHAIRFTRKLCGSMCRRSLTQSPTHSISHSLSLSPTHPLTRPPTHPH